MSKFGIGIAALAAGFTVSTASAQVTLLSDDMSTSGNWSTVDTGDNLATFGFDYSTIGVPPAPGQSLGSETALKLESNLGALAGSDQIAAISNASFAGTYQVSFNFWANYTGPLEFGGSGSTEFIGGGVAHDGVAQGTASGASLFWTGDAGSGTDLRAHKNGSLIATAGNVATTWGFNPAFINGNHDGIAGAGLFPSVTAPAAQVALHPFQIEATRAGAAGFAWHEAVITVVAAGGGKAHFDVDGIRVLTMDQNAAQGGAFSTTGQVSLIYADLFSSLAGNPAVSFGLFTNVLVTDAPEPASLGLMGIGGLMMLRRRSA